MLSRNWYLPGLIAFICWQSVEAANTVAEAYLLQGKRYADLGRLLDAKHCFEQALDASANDPADAEKAAMLNNLGEIERRLADQEPSYKQKYLDDAAEHLGEAIRIKEAIYKKDSLNVVRAVDNLARVYFEKEEFALSESLYRKGLTIRETQQGAGTADCLEELFYLARIAEAQQRYGEAEKLLRKHLLISTRAYSAGSVAVAKAQKELAKVLIQEGKHAEAKKQLLAARKVFAAKLGYASKESADCMDLERQIP